MRRHITTFCAVALSALCLCALERIGKVELVSADLSKRAATVAWTWTEIADSAVRLSLSRNGDDFPTAGWGGTLFIGDGTLGCAVSGVTNGYNELLFDVGRESIPTNGKYAVQILATNETGRVEEWARGTLTVRANPAAGGMPASWSLYEELARKVAPFIDADGILTNPENADALWGAVSNKTDALIQAVSPTPDFTTNNQTLVDTIVAKAPPPDLSGVVHGDDREADKAFIGLKFRASDDDGGNLRLLVGDPSGVGLRWYSDSTGTSLGNPFFALTYFGITHPTAEGAEDTTLTTWDDFTRAQKVRDVMPDRSDTANRKYPISGGAFLDYFWGLNSLPTGAVQNLAGQITPNAASNLVRSSGALIGADGIMEDAAMLTATSAVPFYSFSPWQTDWPDDYPAQPTQPVWTNDAWAVWVVDGSWKDGPFTVQGSEADTNLNYSLYGYETRFWRTATPVGDLNAYGLARLADVTNEVPYYTELDTWICDKVAGEGWKPEWTGSNWYMSVVNITLPPETQRYVLKDATSPETGLGDFIYTRIASSSRNALGLARLSDLAPSVSNTVTKAYVEGLGIEAGISAENATNIAFAVSADATNSLANSLAPTITNIAPTRAEVEAGWWSEWICEPSVYEAKSFSVVEDGLIYDLLLGGDQVGAVNRGDVDTHIVFRANVDWIGDVDVTATRHRVAAPVPTKISDLTNDIGYVSASTATNIASTVSSSAIANADTTYRRTIGLTNLNQSVQYVSITNTSPTTLSISMPTDGVTKDWMVYVTAVTNVTLSLPSATWWMADAAYTNEVPPATPTALWFSQVTDGIFILGRQELTEVTAP